MIGTGLNYNVRNFSWSISGNINGKNPNILSEVVWQDVQDLGVSFDAEYDIWKRLSVGINYNKSAVFKGSASDTDYEYDNRQSILRHAQLSANRGYQNSYQVRLMCEAIRKSAYTVTITGGYGQVKQQYTLLELIPNQFEGKDLNSTYDPDWNGFAFGLKVDKSVSKKLKIENTFQYWQIRYNAIADWNLKDNFMHPISFKHTALGYSLSNETKMVVPVGYKIGWTIGAAFSYATTGNGIDELFLVNNEKAFTRLNSAHLFNWTAISGVYFFFGNKD